MISLIAAGLIALLATAMAQPIEPSCFEYCSLTQDLAAYAIALVSLVWLAGALAMAWWIHRRQPALAALSAITAAVFVAIMAGLDASLWATPSSYDSPEFLFDQLILVLAMGVQLPAIWRLAGSTAPQSIGRAAAPVAGLTTFAVAFAFVALGTTPFNSGPQVQFVAYLVFSADVAVLAAAAWKGAGRERPGLALLAGASLFYAVIGAYYEVSPIDSTAILLLATPVVALGWLWIGLAWSRSPAPTGPVPTGPAAG